MLYTIMPPEEIWAEEQEDVELKDVDFQGCMMQIEPVDTATGKVVRILSTDPQDYLNPAFQPGSIVAIPQQKN